MSANKNKFCKGFEILIVDDEATVAKLISEMVQTKGCSTTVFNNSPAALDYFLGHKDSIDLVITDQTMPEMSGAQLAETILQAKQEIPIFLMTGYSESIDPAKAHEMGIKEFIHKPLKLADLSERLQKHLPDKPGS